VKKYAYLIKQIEEFSLLSQAEKTYGPYTRQDGRKIVIVVNDDGYRKTMSYPKYLLQEHLGYPLSIDQTVDHIDRDHNNNDINNLRIMPRSEHSRDDTRRVKLLKFVCSMCQKDFERSPRLIRDKSKKGKSGPFCSRQCAGRYARQLQLKLLDKLPGQPYIESEYYRNIKNIDNNITAVAGYLIQKYRL
jgi:hypothetical protein